MATVGALARRAWRFIAPYDTRSRLLVMMNRCASRDEPVRQAPGERAQIHEALMSNGIVLPSGHEVRWHGHKEHMKAHSPVPPGEAAALHPTLTSADLSGWPPFAYPHGMLAREALVADDGLAPPSHGRPPRSYERVDGGATPAAMDAPAAVDAPVAVVDAPSAADAPAAVADAPAVSAAERSEAELEEDRRQWLAYYMHVGQLLVPDLRHKNLK